MGVEVGSVSRRRTILVVAGMLAATLLVGGAALSQTQKIRNDPDLPEAEFHIARLAFPTSRRANSRGYNTPMWAVDYPMAEVNFLPALSRLTNLSVAPAVNEDVRHFELGDERLFDYPFLWLQQPAAAGWNPTKHEAEFLREYIARGGFLLVDDFHGQNEFYRFQSAISRVFPGREIVPIPDDDPMMSVFYDLGDRVQIPGLRHLRGCAQGDQFFTSMAGDPYWLGIYDDDGRLVVGINYNIDMGDAWEHADDPCYPAVMTGQAYRLGVNYIIYAMTH